MGHLIAYVGNEPENLACALSSARSALTSRSPDRPEGWGLGFVQGGDVLLQKRPRAEATEIDLYGLVKDLRADAIVGRVGLGGEGKAEGKAMTAENADPFRFRSWLFGSVGELADAAFEGVLPQLLESVPDFLRRNIRGKSPSEHLFHLFLAFLHDAGSLDAPSPSPTVVHGAVRSTLAFIEKLLASSQETRLASSQAPSFDDPRRLARIALVATNGRCFLAANVGHPLRYLHVEGIADCPVCRGRVELERDGRRISHEGLRAVIVEASRAAEGRAGWRELPDRSALLVGVDRVPHVSPL